MARRVSPQLKAQVLVELLSGEQPALVAERHGLPSDTVRKWKQRFVTSVTGSVPIVTPTRPTVDAQKQTIGELLIELLAAKLKAAQGIAETVQSAEWRAKQSAADLAALGDYLDGSAFAIGDRLAGARRSDADGRSVADPPADAD